MAIKNVRRYLKNRFIRGSECIYHRANSIIDHVTYRATGVKTMEYRSNLKLRLISKVDVFIHDQVVIMVSTPSLRNKKRGRRLIIKAILIEVFTDVEYWGGCCVVGVRVEIRGRVSKIKMIKRLEDINKEVECIAAAWICTKSFWFLRPMDELLSFSSMRMSLGV